MREVAPGALEAPYTPPQPDLFSFEVRNTAREGKPLNDFEGWTKDDVNDFKMKLKSQIVQELSLTAEEAAKLEPTQKIALGRHLASPAALLDARHLLRRPDPPQSLHQ